METLVSVLSAIGESTRLRILALCAQSELTVSELQQVLTQSQPRISRHLKILCDIDLLGRRREGAYTFYRLRRGGKWAELAQEVIARVPVNDPMLLGDRDRLAQVKQTRRQAAELYFRSNAGRWDQIRSLHADNSVIEARLSRIVPVGDDCRLIDIGTGTGRMLQIFAPRIAYGLGVDLSHAMLTVARVNLDDPAYANCEVRHGDMYRLPSEDGSFDVAILHMVLHYAEHPAEAVREAARVLRPGGSLVVVDFAPHENPSLLADHAHRWAGFAEETIEGFFADAGLEPRGCEGIGGGELGVTICSARQTADVAALQNQA